MTANMDGKQKQHEANERQRRVLAATKDYLDGAARGRRQPARGQRHPAGRRAGVFTEDRNTGVQA